MGAARIALRLGATITFAAFAIACGDESSAGSSGATGTASGGGAGGFVPAAHPAAPQVVTLGGPVLKAPKVQAIAYASDPGRKDIEAFLQELTKTSYWRETTSEYGVGPLTILPVIALAEKPPPTMTDAQIRASLVANTTGASPAWGAPDPSTIYLFVMPEGTHGGGDCGNSDAYHEVANVGTVQVPYAVSNACPGFDGADVTVLEGRTINISHELIESATDPLTGANPAYAQADDDDLFWSVATGGELADMCQYNLDAYIVPEGGTYTVQRSWSNAAAKATENPCVPRAASAVYFNSFPALTDVSWSELGTKLATHGVQIPVGSSKVVDLELFSTAQTDAGWTVKAYDYNAAVHNGVANLSFSFDQTSGKNGDTLHLTVSVESEDPSIHGEGFILVSDLGNPGDPGFAENITMAVVVP